MLAAVHWFATVGLVIGRIAVVVVAVLAALAWRQGWQEGSTVEMPGGETMRLPDERRPGGFAD